MPTCIIDKRSSRTADNRYNYAISPDTKLPIIRPFGSSFFPSSIELWNSLPFDVKRISQHYEYLTKLKLYVWSKIISQYELEPDWKTT